LFIERQSFSLNSATFASHFLKNYLKKAAAVVHNFNSGPSVLPREVMEEASRAILDFNNTGLSILEIGPSYAPV